MLACASVYFSNHTWYRGFGKVAPAPWSVMDALGGSGSVMAVPLEAEGPAPLGAVLGALDDPPPPDGLGVADEPHAAASRPVARMRAPRRRVRTINLSSSWRRAHPTHSWPLGLDESGPRSQRQPRRAG